MHAWTRSTLFCAGLAALAACGGEGPSDADAGRDPDGGTQQSRWTLRTHPCTGNRTDTLWVDDDGTLYVGCGSTTAGLGLFVSTDGGATWAAPTTTPSNYFGTWRVLDISRSADGLLYVAGTDTTSSARVVSADTSSATWALELVYEAGNTVGTSFIVGTFRRNADGLAVAESLTGVDIQARASDDDWQDVSSWGSAQGGLQILDLEIHDGRFFGCGSTISDPPYLYRQNGDDPLGFDVEQMVTGLGAYDGEMWSIDVDASGIIVGGVDQDRDTGWVYAYEAHDGGSRYAMDLRTFFPDDASWIRGVCRNGEDLMAVGELSTRSRGIVIVSADNGATWRNVTPDTNDSSNPFPPVHECVIRDDGTTYVAGAGGMLAVLSP